MSVDSDVREQQGMDLLEEALLWIMDLLLVRIDCLQLQRLNDRWKHLLQATFHFTRQ